MTCRPAVVSLAALLAVSGVARAAEPATRPAVDLPAADRLLDRIRALDLTPDQKQQFEQLRAEVAETVRGMAAELKDLTPAERREKLRQTLDIREKAKAILTPEQLQQLKDTAEGRRDPGRKPLKDLKADAKAAQKGGATTRPAADGPLIARVRQALGTLGLTAEQKEKTDAILTEANEQTAKLRQEAAGDREAVRDKAKETAQGLRTKLAEVLTAEQKEKLAQTMPGLRNGPAGNGANRRENRREKRDNAAPATQPTGGPAVEAKPDAAKTLAAGDAAPAFTLRRLNGSAVTNVTNKTFAGKPLVLAFGSLSSPAFRDRVPRLEAVKNQYRGRAAVLVVYTKEEHPADGWQVDRNKDDKIEVNQTKTMDERLALAAQLRDKTKTTLDIAVDDTTDAVATAYGSRLQGAAVISRYGKVIGTQTYCDPSGLPRMIDEALAAKE